MLKETCRKDPWMCKETCRRDLKMRKETLRWRWVFLERTRILSAIQFTTHFIQFFFVETKRFVGSTVNVNLTWQTCGQRSSRAAESKCWALENYNPKRICYVFLKSKYRGHWNLGLCTFWVLAKREPLFSGNSWEKKCFARRKNRNSALRSSSLFASTQTVHRPRSQSPLLSDFRNT